MIVKPALAAMLASGLVVPEVPKLVFPKPAIVKAENLDFSKHMLLGMPLTMGMLAPKDEAYNISYLGGAVLSTSNPFFTNFNFGAPHPNREIFVAFVLRNQSTWTSATIGGVNAPKFTTARSTSSNPNAHMGGFFASVPTGSTGTISIIGPGSTTYIVAWRVVNRPGRGNNQSDGQSANAGSASSLSLGFVNIPVNGFLLTSAWTGSNVSSLVSTPSIITLNGNISTDLYGGSTGIQGSSVTPVLTWIFSSSGSGSMACAWSFA